MTDEKAPPPRAADDRLLGFSARAWAYVIAGVFAASIGYGLLRMPVQVYDSLTEIVDASRSPSPWASFVGSLGTTAYLRPLRIAQIKLLFDAADGNYWLAYRGFHAALLAGTLFLFTRALRVRTAADLAAAAFALTVLTGHQTFLGFVEEAFPINHFLEMAFFCLVALNLAQERPTWIVGGAAALAFVCAALTLESGLLVWVVAAACWIAGWRGISTRWLLVMTGLLAGYLYLRFGYLDTGTPSLTERSSGYLLRMLDPPELQQRFGANPLEFYAYNVIASMLSVAASEPQSGEFVAVRAWIENESRPHLTIAVFTSVTTFALMVWACWSAWRHASSEPARTSGRLLLVAAGVIAANAVLSYAYTKDEIMSIGGAFYALAAFAAARMALDVLPHARVRAAALALSVLLLFVSSGWAIRSLGVHHVLRSQQFKHRNDWAVLPGRWKAEGRWPDDPRERALILGLRDSAIQMRSFNPRFVPVWADQLWGAR